MLPSAIATPTSVVGTENCRFRLGSLPSFSLQDGDDRALYQPDTPSSIPDIPSAKLQKQNSSWLKSMVFGATIAALFLLETTLIPVSFFSSAVFPTNKLFESSLRSLKAPRHSKLVPSVVTSQVSNAATQTPPFHGIKYDVAPSTTFTIKRNTPYNNTFNHEYQCRIDANRAPLPSSLAQALAMTTWIETPLKVTFFGDSVAIHFGQIMEEAAGGMNRTTYRYDMDVREGVSITAPLNGGGVLAKHRITKMWLRDGVDKPLPNSRDGGWRKLSLRKLMKHRYGSDQKQVETMDVMVFLIPHGWMGLDGITEESLTETLELAYEFFQVKNVIFPTLPLINNVEDMDKYTKMVKKNNFLRSFARDWRPPSNGGVERVQILEFDRLTRELIDFNAAALGFKEFDDSYLFSRRLSNRLRCHNDNNGISRSIHHVCGAHTKKHACNCIGNSLTFDGMHWCQEHLGGRVNAGLACLMDCTSADCDRACNDVFMTTTPVDPSLYDKPISSSNVMSFVSASMDQA
jgi:hypothetical protein